MAVASFSPALRICIAALLFAPFGSASPKGRPASPSLMIQPIHVRQWSNGSLPIIQPLPPDTSNIVPDNSPTSTCQTYSPCNLFYQYVSIYYWPSDSQNTACLDSLASPPTTSSIPGIQMVSPSIYAIFPSIMASDGCNQIGNTYGPITTSFAPGELSTIDIRGHSTNVFNFDDLPCPPPGIDVPSGKPYAPLISPPPFIWGLDSAFSGCIPGASQGLDPPVAVHTTNGPAGPGAAGGAPRRRDLGASPWGPIKTPGPALKVQL